MKRSAWILTLVLLVAFSTGLYAAPTIDAPKPAEEPLDWQLKSKFSTLHEESDEDVAAKWPGYGSFKEARRVISFALRNCPSSPGRRAYDHFMDALRDAAEVCGDADKYRRLILALRRSGDAADSYSDCAKALRGGCDYLVNGSGGSMTKSMCQMALAMIRPQMSSFKNAYKITYKVIEGAQREARQENKQWYSILTFTKVGAEKTESWANGYRVLERIAHTVANAQQGQTVFMVAMVNISRSGFTSNKDLYNVLVAGLRQYRNDVPSKTHKVVADYLLTCADKIKTWDSARRFLVAAVEKFQNVAFDAPAAKVLLKATYGLSGGSFSSTEDAYNVAVVGLRKARRLDLPGHIGRMMDRAIRSAESARTYREGLRIARAAINDILSS